MIGRYSLSNMDGKALSIDEILKNRVAIVDDYRGRIGTLIIKNLVDLKGDTFFIFHDFHGYFRVFNEEILRVYAGLDIKFPNIDIDEFDYFLIITELLHSILRMYGFKNHHWRIILTRGLEDAIKRSDGTFKSMMMEIQALKDESSGLEKELYIEIVNVFRNILSYDDIENLNGEFESSIDRKLSGNVVVDYTRVKNFIGRHFLMALYHFEIMRNNPKKYQVLPYADYLFYTKLVYNHFLNNTSNKYGLYFLQKFDRKLYEIADIIIVNNRRIVHQLGGISYLPAEAINTEYTVLDRYSIDFLKVPYIKLEEDTAIYQPLHLETDYLSTYKDEIRAILSHILDKGRSSIDGIVIATGLDRRLVYSLVDRLWREGYVKRLVGRAGVAYRISVKGVKFLKGG